MGTLFNFVQGIRKLTRLHQPDFNLIHAGSSNSSVSTCSSNSRFVSSPSPLKVDKLILSAERFLVNLQF